MIYTITFNPALDYIVSVEDFHLGMTNRTSTEQILAGGKGLNVSTVLQNLGYESIALGFVAGFTGEEIKRLTKAQGLLTDFIALPEGASRINVKLQSGEETEINGMGPDIHRESLERLLAKLDTLQKGDVLVLAGSIPKSLPTTVYSDIMQRLGKKEVAFVVDATKDLLLKSLEHKPFLIKPNHHELGEIFAAELHTREEVIPYAVKLREMGAVNVLVSLSGEGAVLAAADGEIYHAPAPEGKVINAVGAGDSMVAGFLAGYLETGDYNNALRMGLAAGSASAFSEHLAEKSEIEALLKQI